MVHDKSVLTRSSLSYCSSSSPLLRSADCASTDPATSSKVASSLSLVAYCISKRGNQAGVGERQSGSSQASFRMSHTTCSHLLSYAVTKRMRSDALANCVLNLISTQLNATQGGG